ncbi:MAG: hypothetical protein WA254_19545 [Candidatus Sulfotelmatobacter sp.]
MLLNIEKLIYGGDGLARFLPNLPPIKTADAAKAVLFFPFVLAGEKIERREWG